MTDIDVTEIRIILEDLSEEQLTALRNMISDKNKLRNLFDAIYENEK